jgi:EAL domain-containing protein (putative c-di-GMP-specific phosphodiesterase class I)
VQPVDRVWTAAGQPPSQGLPSGDVPAAFGASRVHARYQPIVAIADRTPLALEVLARLDHPTLGVLFPSHFVPQIEQAGLARALTEAVIDIALTDHAVHLGGLGLGLSLNFPLEVLIRHSFGDWLERRRIAQAVPARQLIIELTESQPVANLNQAERRQLAAAMVQVRDRLALGQLAAAMSRLRARGYRLAIDDFGPDMPRRQLLFTLPFDLLKLDKSIVIDQAHPRVVEQAILMAHRHGLKVVAEGVETSAGWDRMGGLGVEYVQGFLVSRPLPCREVSAWLDAWRAPAA